MYSRGKKLQEEDQQITDVQGETHKNYLQDGGPEGMAEAGGATAKMPTGTTVAPMVAPQTDMMPESTLDTDPEKKAAKEKAKAKKRFEKGQAIVNANMGDIPGYNYEGTILKLKKRWIKEDNWEYYLPYIGGFKLAGGKKYDNIKTYQDFLALDSTPDSKWFNVRGEKIPYESTELGKRDRPTKKTEKDETVVTDTKGPEEEIKTTGDPGKEAEGPGNEIEQGKEDPVVEDPVVEDPVVEDPVVTGEDKENKPVDDLIKKDEIMQPIDFKGRKIIRTEAEVFVRTRWEYEEAKPALQYTATEDGQIFTKEYTLDPEITYWVQVRGVMAKDRVKILVDGKDAPLVEETDYLSGRRHYKIPKGTTSLEIVAQAEDAKSVLTALVLHDKKIEIVEKHIMATTYYDDGTSKTKRNPRLTGAIEMSRKEIPYNESKTRNSGWVSKGKKVFVE